MSTSGSVSKFGIAFQDYEESIFSFYEHYSWLNGIHVHVGSQGLKISFMIKKN